MLALLGGYAGFAFGRTYSGLGALIVGLVGALVGLLSYTSVLAYTLTWAFADASIGYTIGHLLGFTPAAQGACSLAGFVIGAGMSRRMSAWMGRVGTYRWVIRIRGWIHSGRGSPEEPPS